MKDIISWIILIPFLLFVLSYIDASRTTYYDPETQKEHKKDTNKLGLYLLGAAIIIFLIGLILEMI
tara:strand:+ start:546 stop:743 length:198 start_codon:yes stop_codon:yes gene_type:complete